MIAFRLTAALTPAAGILWCAACWFMLPAERGHADDGPVVTNDPASAEQVEFFEKRVRPLLVENCLSCHGDKKQEGGLRLDSRAAALKGGDSGAVILPGKPDDSPLIEAIAYDGALKMPPK